MTPDPNNEPEEELVRTDDAVIGRALRWSAIVFLLLAAIVGGAIYVLRRPPPAAPVKATALATPMPREREPLTLPTVKFTDVTESAGIAFKHFNGATGEKLLPETMGAGCAIFDADGDGANDLLFINGTDWAWTEKKSETPHTMTLYRNDGTGHFADISAGSGLDVAMYGTGVAPGDFDNDGRTDLFVSGVGSSRLFHNVGGGKFRDVTAEAGVGGAPEDWGASSVFFDFDNDGLLDLFVCQYVKWSRAIDFEIGFKLTGVGRAYGPPMNFEGTFSRLYHNDGGGKFRDVSEVAGVQVKNPATGKPAGKALGVAPVDLDGDGWLDLVTANDTVQNFVFHNQRDGTFKEIGAAAGVAFDSYGNTRGAMGIDAAYHRNDGALGIAIGNFANEMIALYVAQRAPLTFADEAIPENVGPASRLLLKFGVLFFDYDLDGWPDLLSANGHLEEEIGKVQQSQTYAQPAQLFWNRGAKKRAGFEPVTAEQSGADLFRPIVGRGAAFGDLDGDGDPDIVLTQTGGKPLVLRNDQKLGHHFIRLKLTGTKSNRDAIGALVRAHVGKEVRTQRVLATRSYLSASELPVTIGLGAADKIDSLEIIWPGGAVQPVTDFKMDGVTAVEQAH